MDCPSCGASGQQKAHCEVCGFAFPSDDSGVDDSDVLSLFLGLVCASCDGYNDPGTSSCVTCGAPLEVGSDLSEPMMAAPAPPTTLPSAATTSPSPATTSPSAAPMSAPPSWMTPPSGHPLSTQFAMKKVDLAVMAEGGAASLAAPSPSTPPAPVSSVASSPSSSAPTTPPASATIGGPCWRCQSTLELNDKFCRSCGARVDGAPAVGTVGAVGAVVAGAAGGGSAATQMIASLAAPPSVSSPSSSATMVLPAMKLAASSSPSSPPSKTPGPTATMVFGAVTAERTAKLILVRGNTQFGSQWRLQAGEALIGRNEGMVLFPDDTAIAPKHARLSWRGEHLMLEPLPTTNGVFVRVRAPLRLHPGDEFLVGAQRLRVMEDADRGQAMHPRGDDTRLLGSALKQTPPIALMRVGPDPGCSEVYFRPQRLLTIGRAHCDILFPTDGFVSERHCQLTQEGGTLTLEDLGSRNGTYARARVATPLAHGDLLLMGDQVLRVELPTR